MYTGENPNFPDTLSVASYGSKTHVSYDTLMKMTVVCGSVEIHVHWGEFD
jgi:hypothetical protein